ncbi:MAG: hypothetical protein WBD31_24420 [Rubripirellula sp.]
MRATVARYPQWESPLLIKFSDQAGTGFLDSQVLTEAGFRSIDAHERSCEMWFAMMADKSRR